MIQQLNIESIKQGMPGITPVIGNYLYENCLVSLLKAGHTDGVALQVYGLSEETYNIHWQGIITDQMARSYQDNLETTEQGAVCLSVLLAQHLTGYTIIERSWRGTGIDYWLGYEEDPFLLRAARLEISGIKSETSNNTIAARYEQKAKQTRQSDNVDLPAFISIIEFGTPKCLFNNRQS